MDLKQVAGKESIMVIHFNDSLLHLYLYLLGGPLRRRVHLEDLERELYSWLSIWLNRRRRRRRDSTSVSKYLEREANIC